MKTIIKDLAALLLFAVAAAVVLLLAWII